MFKVKGVQQSLTKVKGDGILLGIFKKEKLSPATQELDKALGGLISKLMGDGEIKGDFKEFTVLHTDKIPTPKIVVIGLGERKDFDLDKIRAISAKGARTFRRIGVKTMVMAPNDGFGLEDSDFVCASLEAMVMGLYRFHKYFPAKKNLDPWGLKEVHFLYSDAKSKKGVEEGLERGLIHGETNTFCRNLVNEPGSTMTPSDFVKEVSAQAKGVKNLTVKILTEKEMKKLGMGALLAVSRGSESPPRLMVLTYNGGGKKDKVHGLVGKGVTYDTGGYDIKTGGSMYRMYGDMAGAAAVASGIIGAAKLGLKKNIVAVAGLTENRIDGKAYLSGDVLESMSGKTIEVLNTDAEGRLVLADCLTYIQRIEKVDEIIDFATLTGAIVIGLGHFVSGAFCYNDDIYQRVFEAGEKSHERIWRLPLYSDYLSQIKSDVADLENSGGRPAGSITAAIFLGEFIENKRPWIHLDIAGTAFMEESIYPYAKKPYFPKEGATGLGSRLLLHYFENKNN